MDLALPLFQPQPTPEPQQIKTQSVGGLLPGRLASVTDMLPVPRFATSNLLPGRCPSPSQTVIYAHYAYTLHVHCYRIYYSLSWCP